MKLKSSASIFEAQGNPWITNREREKELNPPRKADPKELKAMTPTVRRNVTEGWQNQARQVRDTEYSNPLKPRFRTDTVTARKIVSSRDPALISRVSRGFVLSQKIGKEK